MLTTIALGAACASSGTPALVGPPRQQPAALVGRWRPAADSTASELELLANAVAIETVTARDGARATLRRSWWWVYAAAGREPERLCVRWRPGKHAAECAPFAVDSATARTRLLRWGNREYVQMDRSAGDPP